MSQTLLLRLCPKCGTKLTYNLAYGTDDCTKCGYVLGSCD